MIDDQMFPREVCCEVHKGLLGVLAYLDQCHGDVTADELKEFIGTAEKYAKKALEAEMRLFKMCGFDKFPSVQ